VADFAGVLGSEESINYGLYSKLNSYEYHYNSIKVRYKLLSLTWLIAAFIGYGYLISGEEVGLPFSSFAGIAILSLLASVGIGLLCFLDIGIYHRFIEAIYNEHIRLEKKPS